MRKIAHAAFEIRHTKKSIMEISLEDEFSNLLDTDTMSLCILILKEQEGEKNYGITNGKSGFAELRRVNANVALL